MEIQKCEEVDYNYLKDTEDIPPDTLGHTERDKLRKIILDMKTATRKPGHRLPAPLAIEEELATETKQTVIQYAKKIKPSLIMQDPSR